MAMAETSKRNIEQLMGVDRLREEHEKVVADCETRILHWKKVSGDYEALDARLETLPDQLSYDIMVPFGPLAFMPGKLVHTNEVTVLLGDNWFAKCSAKQAQKIVHHRMEYVRNEMEDLLKTKRSFAARVGLTKDLEGISGNKGEYVDIRETMEDLEVAVTKGKHRVAHKPHSLPKLDPVVPSEDEEEEGGGGGRGVLSEEELWARLDELEQQELVQDETDRMSDNADTNAEDTSSSSSEEEKEGGDIVPQNGVSHGPAWDALPPPHPVNGQGPPGPNGAQAEEEDGADAEEDEDESNSLPTIYFSHTVEPKKVRINTGKNTMLKYSERKEQKDHSKRRKKNGHSNGHAHHEHHKISTPADLYRLYVDVRNGEPFPRKSILKCRSRENSVCSDTSESSTADLDERRALGRSYSHEDALHSDASDGITEEDSPTAVPLHPAGRSEAFSGTVVEKDPMPSGVPHLTIAPPALPTIPERKQEELVPEAPQPEAPPKRVSKFKASRLQQK